MLPGMNTSHLSLTVLAAMFLVVLGCARSPGDAGKAGGVGGPSAVAGQWAIVIHGGAGVLSKTAPPEEIKAYEASLARVLAEGKMRLARGDSSLDTVEAIVKMLEEDDKFNAGKGAVFNAVGGHELDASIMDGRTLACGAVAGVRTVRNPIGLARLVMEKTIHVMLIGDGAEQFADAMGVARVPNDWFDTPKRRKALEEVLRERAAKRSDAGTIDPTNDGVNKTPDTRFGTVGCVALDKAGNLAAATSTGGLTGKRFGRIGDSPIIGAGTYAANDSCAISCTGTGEEFIRHTVAGSVAARVKLQGKSLDAAAKELIFDTLKPDDGGLIGVSRSGEMVMVYSSEGMFRAAADSKGFSLVKIWE